MTSGPSHWRWLRPLLLSAASGVAMVACWWFFVTTRHGQVLDGLGYNGAVIGSGLVSDHFNNLLSRVSVGGVALCMLAVALTALLRRRWLLALEAAVVIAGANLSTRVLKYHLFTRPQLLDWGAITGNSYPSGHTTVAASAMVAALLVAPRRARSLVAVLGSAVMILFGYATLAAHWHRPSDVVGGYLVCLCWAFMALCVGSLRHRLIGRTRAELPDERRPSRLVPGLMVLAGLVAAAVAALCGWLSWPVPSLDASRNQLFIAYLGSSAGICAVAVLGMAVLLRLVQLHDARAEQLA